MGDGVRIGKMRKSPEVTVATHTVTVPDATQLCTQPGEDGRFCVVYIFLKKYL